ncbi:MAG: hypothetical protein RBU30_09275 [Polyangia bacterium]|nr:hypothetical protein [Polyangia bacterium]
MIDLTPRREVNMQAPDDRLVKSIAYLEANLDLCRARPEVHTHQIAAFERYLEMARSSSSGQDFMAKVKADGDMFEVNRALALDRYSNEASVHRTMGDDRNLRAAFLCKNAAREAAGHLDLNERLTAATAEAEPLRQAARITTGLVRDLCVTLLDWAMQADPGRRAGLLASLRSTWERLLAHDPDCSFEKLRAYPPYRRRIPFSEEKLSRLQGWFEEALG